MQIITALRKAGHTVTFSMPLKAHIAKDTGAKVLSELSKEEIWACENFFEPEIVLNRVQPDIAIYCTINIFRTISRFAKDIVHVVDFYGPVQLEGLLIESSDPEAAMRDAALLESRCRETVEQIRQVDYIMTVSERQKYFWSAYCTVAGFSLADMNILVCPTAFDVPTITRHTAPKLTVVYSGGFYPWQNPDRFLRATASILEEIDGATLHIFGGPHTGLPNESAVYEMLTELQQYRCVKYHGYRPVEELMATLSTAWCALELMERNLERELAVTGRTVEFLTAGVPVIYNDYATLSHLVKKYNAGWSLSTEDTAGLHSVFEDLARGGHALVDELSGNARRLASAEFGSERSMSPLTDLCDRPIAKRRQRSTFSATTKRSSKSSSKSFGRVLAISPARGALLDLRVNNPLWALQRQGYIDGLSVADPSLESLKHDTNDYDSILVQRAVPEFICQTLNNLCLPFVLDVDDNMLAHASYRRDYPLADIEARQLFVGLNQCSALTVPNPRLIRVLQKYSGVPVAQKAFVTPNSLPYPGTASNKIATQPSQIIWIQSDIAALEQSRDNVVRAVDLFSAKYDLPVVLIGRNVLNRPHFKNQVVMGEIDFTSNLQMLEFAPTSIGVAPLETNADPETLDFIAGKSDLKILLFAGYGHAGVYSASAPYTDSELQTGLSIVENSSEEWMSALEYQFHQGWQEIAKISENIQTRRNSDHVARESWAPALQSCVLRKPIRGTQLYEAFRSASRMDPTPTHSLGYMLANGDVLAHYIRNGSPSPREHYANSGQFENRIVVHAKKPHQEMLDRVRRESSELLIRATKKIEKLQDEIAELKILRDGLEDTEQMNGRTQKSEDESKGAEGRSGKMERLYREKIAALEAQLEGVLKSRSWKLTAPLRELSERRR